MLNNHQDMSDEEREQHIADCGRLMLEAMAAGNREEAEGWLQAQNQAIAARSPEQVARMEAQLGLTPEPYFLNKADEDLPFFFRRQAA